MAKEITKYSKLGAYKSKARTAWKGFAKGATTEQVFLGRSLPRALWKGAKWGFRHPIASTALLLAPKLFKQKKPKLTTKSDPFGITRSRKKFTL